MNLVSQRPQPSARRFTSQAVEQTIRDVSAKIGDAELAWMFENCFPNTLDTTVEFYRDAQNRPQTHVITGDIDAMWLRDSTNQVWPYLPLAHRDPALQDVLRGVINRQIDCVLYDVYANAFYRTHDHVSEEFKNDHTAMKPGLHERKYELDSVCSVLRMSCGYFDTTGDATCFDDRWQSGVELILKTIRTEQASWNEPPQPVYLFERVTRTSRDTLDNDGLGNPFRRTGMSRSPFRPSDDATTFQYLIPANAMAVVYLRQLHHMLERLKLAPKIAADALAIADEIDKAITAHGIITHPKYGQIYAYEIDGYDSHRFMDDSNVPNLLSLPYLGFCKHDDPLYQATRKFVLSDDNPYFANGKAAAGLGSEHSGVKWIWPIGLTMQAMTSEDDAEIIQCLRTLKKTHAGTGFMHEAFDQDNPARFQRTWFAWANSLFGELMVKLEREHSNVLKKA
ncbi:MAG TPA: glycoside hydrolase family 125 protein [Tepidisphaeraceae bacterium]